MASVWIRERETRAGGKRYRVEYRLGGRESRSHYAGSFKRKAEAIERKRWLEGELAARRVPDLRSLEEGMERVPTVTEAAQRWQASRVDLAEATKIRHGLEVARIRRLLGSRRVDEVTPGDVGEFVATLAEDYARGTIRKTVQTLSMILEDAHVTPNPTKDRHVRLPREEPEEINPPTAAHVEAVYRLVPSRHRLPLLWLDWSGARVASVDLTLVSDYDEPRRRVRLRAATTKMRRALWIDLHPALAEALEARLGPREDRNPDARLFADSGADALRTSIAKACRAAGVPLFSPHDLRHRRISLLHLRGVPWVRIGEFVGQRDIAQTANVYSHTMLDEAEVDYTALLR